ncbi:MAG: helix-turn-helix domain-containing protein [Muribaculaceae bacterium]|nr:helix-turn-helix domain-containing protein [Muribaculaceae bacterium]
MINTAEILSSGFYSASEVCRICGISRTTFYRAVRDGRLTPYYLSTSKRPKYHGCAIKQLLKHK